MHFKRTCQFSLHVPYTVTTVYRGVILGRFINIAVSGLYRTQEDRDKEEEQWLHVNQWVKPKITRDKPLFPYLVLPLMTLPTQRRRDG